MIADGTLTDAKTIIGLAHGGPATWRDARPGDAEAPLPLEVEELLTWLAAERGRSANTLDRLPARPAELRRLAARAGGRTWRDVHRGRRRGLRRRRCATRGWRRRRWPGRWWRCGRCTASCADEGLLPTDPAADVELPGCPAGLPKALTRTRSSRLLDAAVGDDPVGPRDRAMLEVLYGTGVRISELVGLSLGDVDLDAALLRAFGKGSKERVVPLGGPAVRALVAWLGPGGRPALAPEQWPGGATPRRCS